jgi:hypothetical protein
MLVSLDGPRRRANLKRKLTDSYRILARAYAYSGKPKADHSAKYFSHSDEQASKVREQLAEESLESLISWLKSEGNVGIMGKLLFPGCKVQADI